MVSLIVYYLFHIIFVVILLECLLSWIPNIDRNKQPFKFIHNFAELFLSPARMIIPPIGGLDISPIFVMILLQFCGYAIVRALSAYGL